MPAGNHPTISSQVTHRTVTANRNNVLHLDDLRLVRRVRAGDEHAFRQLFDEHYDRLFRFALLRLGQDEDVVEDIVQQSLTKAIQALDTYRGEANLQTWLCTICRNAITDWQRKQGLYEKNIVRAEDHPGIRGAVESFRAPDSDDPLLVSQKLELTRLIQVALDRLPKNYGDALEWKYVEGQSVKEIAERLQIGREAVQSLLARAKRAFAEVYGSLADAHLATSASE